MKILYGSIILFISIFLLIGCFTDREPQSNKITIEWGVNTNYVTEQNIQGNK